MSTEIVSPLSHETALHGRQKAKSLPTVVYRMNSNGSASFNIDDDYFNFGEQEINTSESGHEDSPSTESLDIHLNW